MNAVVTMADAHAEALSPEIADAVLAALVEQGPSSTLDRAIAALEAIAPEFRRLGAAFTAAEDAAIALRSRPEAEQVAAATGVEAAEAAWVAVQDRRIDLALLVLKVPATDPTEMLRKLDAYASAFDVDVPSALYDRRDMAAAIDAVAIDLRAMRDADAHLLALEAEFERRWALEREAEQRLDGIGCPMVAAPLEAELTTASAYSGRMAEAIMGTPAHTLAGLRLKARVMAWTASDQAKTAFESGHCSTVALKWADRFFADLLAGPTPTPAPAPSTLSAMDAAYRVWEPDSDEPNPMATFAEAPCLDATAAIEKLRFVRISCEAGTSLWDEQVLDQVIAFIGREPSAGAMYRLGETYDGAFKAYAAAVDAAEAAGDPVNEAAAREAASRCSDVEKAILQEASRSLPDLLLKARIAHDHDGGQIDDGDRLHGGIHDGDDFGTLMARAIVRDLVSLGARAA